MRAHTGTLCLARGGCNRHLQEAAARHVLFFLNAKDSAALEHPLIPCCSLLLCAQRRNQCLQKHSLFVQQRSATVMQSLQHDFNQSPGWKGAEEKPLWYVDCMTLPVASTLSWHCCSLDTTKPAPEQPSLQRAGAGTRNSCRHRKSSPQLQCLQLQTPPARPTAAHATLCATLVAYKHIANRNMTAIHTVAQLCPKNSGMLCLFSTLGTSPGSESKLIKARTQCDS